MTVATRMQLIREACTDLEAVPSNRIDAVIETAERHTISDAACLNLLGVARELLGEVDAARHFYRQAIRADRHFEPAQQNMRRLFELNTYGGSSQSLAVGHALTDLVLQRQ